MPGIITSAAMLRGPVEVKVRDMVFSPRVAIDITLNRTTSSNRPYLHSYSTLDNIDGTVSITPKHDTPFDDLDINLIGKCVLLSFCTPVAQAALNSYTFPTPR